MRLLLALRCDDAMKSAVCAIALLLLTARSSSAETLFHLRDFHDHPDQPGAPKTISSKEEAKTYLEKYGYLNCSGGRSRRELPMAREGSDNRGSDNCTDEEIQRALRTLQRHLNLRQSGELDDSTKQKMSMERCGNEDKDLPVDSLSNSRATKPPTVADDGLIQRHSGGRLHIHEADGSGSKSPTSSQPSSGRRTRRSLQSSEQKDTRSLLARIHSPIIREGRNTKPHREASDEEIWANVRTKLIKDKLKRRVQKSNVFLDLIENYKKKRARRKKRTASGNQGGQFNADTRRITWEFPEQYLSGTLPEVDQKSLVSRAFRMWSEVSPVVFKEQSQPDITVAFGKERHLGCQKVFDGKGGEVAHSWAAGDIHFDQDENYRWDSASHGVNFGRVAMHEIGHVLGLEHTEDEDSVMYPVLVDSGSDTFELPDGDRRYIQSLYGRCKGSFDIVFDWLRLEQPIDYANPSYVFNTYFFRGSHYWMYENRYNRPRYGDPLHTVVHWNGLPEQLDAYAQVRLVGSVPYWHIQTYFFKGAYVYLYNDVTDRVEDGYPKPISEVFGPKNSAWEPIPENLDAAFFHMNSNMIYFFKDNWVWRYPVDQTGVVPGSCCEEKILFTDMFPVQTVTGPRVDGYIDSVYAKAIDPSTTYLFKGEQVYQMNPVGSRWSLVQIGPWYDEWNDICDVE